MNNSARNGQWQSSLLITFAVILTVLAALLMVQYDTLQQRSLILPKELPVLDEVISEPSVERQYAPFPNNNQGSPGFIDAVRVDTDTAVPPIEACSTSPTDWQPYTVRPGDSISQLARQHATTTRKIREANCLSDNQLKLGQRLLLPPQET